MTRVVVVRDRASRSLLLGHPKVRLAPDLAWLQPLEPQDRPPEEPVIGLNLRARARARWSPEAIGGVVRAAAASVVALPFHYGDGTAREAMLCGGGRSVKGEDRLAWAAPLVPTGLPHVVK